LKRTTDHPTPRTRSLALIRIGAIVAASMICVVSASAQVIVINSSVPKLKTGQMLPNSAVVSIPQGGTVMFVLSSGATRTVKGPYKGKISELTKGTNSNSALFNAVKEYVKTGGSSTSSVGAMRSIRPTATPPRKIKFSWKKIPITAQGDICVEKGAEIVLVRGKSGRQQSVTVVNMNTTKRARTQFDIKATSTAWPSDLTPENGSYAILASEQAMHQIRLRLISPIPTADQILRVLHGQRCKLQFEAYLRGVMLANR